MDANQRSEANKQTNNGGNEKGTPGAQGKTRAGGALDHTYPKGAEAAPRVTGAGHKEGSMQSGVGPGVYDSSYQRSDGKGEDLKGGSMQTQQTGGSGAQQGITDSHQQAMEQRSGAYGKLEQPVGDRPRDQGVSLQGDRHGGKTPATERMNPQNAAQPELQSGSAGGVHGNQQSSTQGGGQRGPNAALPRNLGGSMGQQSASTQGTQGGGQAGPQSDPGSVQRGGSMHQQSARGQSGTQPDQRSGSGQGHDSTDRIGSQTGNYQREMGVHQSNDLQGGLPRSPGNAGPYPDAGSTHQTGPDNHADLLRNDRGIHESNNSSGGLPRSPGGANKLAADEKMDDDTGFSNPRRR
ncbi:hypothetical protein GCM10027321_20870 [Massilia terrae]|uniref:Uncharacterized protein n=1 Tax=Massilia terrae TaxID=1811224 RepID=A0ABT2CWC0_9BURK|nr:hypothetical protein [Massilia terrae]MCS0657906.1 hypothetical protein [Massilia terrae]